MTGPQSLPAPFDFDHVRDWIFDLDNTLYPHEVDLFSQVDRNMTAYVAHLLHLQPEEARRLQKRYYHDHGTTLAGLMRHHGVDPTDFLAKAHAIDYTGLQPDAALGEAIRALPGRRFIFTNGTVQHAEDVARALGILDHFDDIFDIVAADYQPKPADVTYDRFARRHGIDPARAAMFEDLPRNLLVPKALGMRTVLLLPRQTDGVGLEPWERLTGDGGADHVDYATDDLTGFLRALPALGAPSTDPATDTVGLRATANDNRAIEKR